MVYWSVFAVGHAYVSRADNSSMQRLHQHACPHAGMHGNTECVLCMLQASRRIPWDNVTPVDKLLLTKKQIREKYVIRK